LILELFRNSNQFEVYQSISLHNIMDNRVIGKDQLQVLLYINVLHNQRTAKSMFVNDNASQWQ
jgi:hypothetical protein